jgi:uncharacterized protein YodC (DUF2158 family)
LGNQNFRVKNGLEVGTGITISSNGNINASGISTFNNVVIGGATTSLLVQGSARITGILSVGQGTIIFDGDNNIINVGSGITLSHTNGIYVGSSNISSNSLSISNINASGIVTASSFNGPLTGTASTASFATTSFGLSGNPSISVTGINASGVVTASSFVGNLTGTASTASFATTSFGLSGSPSISVTDVNASGVVTASSFNGPLTGTASTASFATTSFGLSGNPSISVTGVNASGVVTASSFNGYQTLVGAASSATKTFIVTVASKTTNHRYYGSGSGSAYFIDGSESPFITLLPGKTYRFNQEDNSNSSHPLRFYLQSDKTTQYSTNVTTNGTAGSAGAYTEIIITDTTPIVLHYQCSAHGYMGNAVSVNSNFIDTPHQITARNGINVTGIVTATSGIVTYFGDISNAVSGRWILGANGSSDYTFTGIGFTQTTNDPTLYLKRGEVYQFINTMDAHPFRIQSTPNGSVGTQYNKGITNNDVSNGTLTWIVSYDAPDYLYYQCTAHLSMGGEIHILGIRGIPQNSQTSAYNLSISDLGKHISITTGGATVNSGIFSAGDTIAIYNNSGSNQTITQGAGVTLRFAGTSNTGNRTLAQYGLCTVLCVSSNTFVISGSGLS